MKVIKPTAITAAMLVSSTASEPSAGESLWNFATAYAAGVQVISPATHRTYLSLQANNQNHDPALSTSLAWWQDIGPSNAWAMFDGEVGTQTAVASPLTVVLRPGFFNAVALFGLDGTALTITVKDAPGGAILFSLSTPLDGGVVSDWYEYFFASFNPQTDLVVSGIEPYYNAELMVTITGGSAVKCGVLAVGDLKALGDTQYGASARLIDYSTITVNTDGTKKLKKRRNVKGMEARMWLKTEEANRVQDDLSSLMAVPCVWIGSDLPQYRPLRVFGIIRDSAISFDYPKDALLTMTIEGMT